MTKRIIVPTEDQNGLNTALAQHFGRAPYFTVVELDDSGNVANVKAVANTGEHAGGVGQAHDHIVALQPDAIVAYGMGPRGLMSFANAGIKVLKANADTVNEVVTAYKEGKLLALTDGCEHAHHQ
ncbi:MAG: NifB/NifX family molybdenum-iron cluster-binding protein [Candidatus Bathyarchaeota archaeon]|nr:NifB/NifX family molybdenum-iron cluster-binding protein [Candidatus Bathyarchaeota archaeon]